MMGLNCKFLPRNSNVSFIAGALIGMITVIAETGGDPINASRFSKVLGGALAGGMVAKIMESNTDPKKW